MTAPARRAVIERAATELFADRGYHGTSMEAIAQRSGVSVPVVYDHFASKKELHRRLLEQHFAELRDVWAQHLAGPQPAAERLGRAIDAWFAYVQDHRYAWRMLFRETTGDPEVEAIHRDVAARSRAALLPLLAQDPAGASASATPHTLEMLWEVFRAVLQGLALWWYEHQDVPRDQVVATAMNSIWVGFERLQGGERWQPYSS